MYVETDFLLALIKNDDWLGEAAATVYDEHNAELWTSQFTLIELLMVAYREDRNVERVIGNAVKLIDVRGDVETVVTAASFVEDHGMTPFDALHLVAAGNETIVSSDNAYADVTDYLDLKSVTDN
jgi:predicted nucleic acid-binding protein